MEAGNARRYKREQGREYTKWTEASGIGERGEMGVAGGRASVNGKRKRNRGGIFRRLSATYHKVVNSAPTFPREIIIFPLVKSDSTDTNASVH